MRFTSLLCGVIGATVVFAKLNPEDLLDVGEVGIEITKQIPIDECKIKASNGDTVVVHYTGKLEESDEVFDSSYEREKPLTFQLGVGQVIRGWDLGLLGMCVGEERTLTIPSGYGYGTRGIPGLIPGDATLVFDVKLINAVNKN
ncbi:hypothetical protein KAFR_0G01230 [Kazachstania africana CBS 2517]|uniref:peptidylprolyl isomerase n=1 Tax=Kazachstania africana (strain ATCC 22294 / BCRC 22015 / CBS 2517 / CECT 1963 / NBRC 1671 / NRRL Y-8276) TaxID=1071382 RepID=H2AXQ7_KAZAF|nr:hypothetical protein KAFR_0G01230 [Kazachstania africana CBS 2517]CCF59157.1 hypothetical protein KAFR_0G01230 [Kazachstania africana CBS 2517]